jgi:hypothetical protein
MEWPYHDLRQCLCAFSCAVSGTGYTGEMKKGIFSALNLSYLFSKTLPMHCSANVGEKEILLSSLVYLELEKNFISAVQIVN